jgi:uncharacterized protein YjbI with pentapeptide repeats
VRVVKPNQLSVLSRPFDHNNRYTLGVTGLVLFPFAEPRYPMTESALWMLVGQELEGAVLDEAMPKRRGEILMRANAYAPGGRPRPVVRAALELDGRLMKEIAVVGDRVWKDSVPTEPEPFLVKGITWENTFGGEEWKPNPVGKGYPAKNGTPLPNVEDPRRLLTSPRQTPAPVGVGPIDITRPERQAKAGTYDQAWLDRFYPGLARDIDWSFFNVAPLDQQIPGFFRGDEEIVLHNLHPSTPELRFRLPEVQVRCFLRRKPRSGDEIQSEIEMHLDTVWLFPHALHGIVLFHGAAPIREDDASDVTLLYLACEDLGRPKPLAHYDEVLERRLSKEHGAVAALDDRPLLPELRAAMRQPPSPADELAELCAIEQLSQQNLNRMNERQVETARSLLRAQGLDPDQHGPPVVTATRAPGSIEEAITAIEKMEQEMLELRRAAEESRDKREEVVKRLCEEAGLDFEEIRKEWRGPFKGGPPELRAEKDLARLRTLAADSRAAGFDAAEIDAYLADPEFVAMVRDQDRTMLEAYRVGAQQQSEPELLGVEENKRLREELLAAHERGESLAGRDLTGADLSGIQLPGANLEEALMERCDLSYANLAWANLKRAVLVRATLSFAHLDGADLEAANLSKAYGKETTFEESKLKDAMFFETHLVSANLDGVHLEGALLGETRLERCTLRGAQAEGIMFDGVDLAGLSFSDAVLTDAVFMKCGLDRVDFTEAKLTNATLFACHGSGAIFAKVSGKSLRAVEGTELPEADFRGADLENACLRGTNLAGSDFTGVRAKQLDLSESNLQGARLVHLYAREGSFIRADLTRADLTGADLYEALLSKAVLCGANLTGASLYQADLAMVRGDVETKLEDTIQVRARIKPFWSDKIQDLD